MSTPSSSRTLSPTKRDALMSKIILSPVKRERLKKQERQNKREKLRANLPVLTKEQIRRYRMPLHEAIFIEMTEHGLPSSAAFIKQLIDYQEYIRQSHGRESRTWSKPRLIDRPDMLSIICSALRSAETAHYANDFASECDKFIELSAYFAFFCNNDDWWWLAEQLFLQSAYICMVYQGDGGRRDATCRYIFGKFLLENVHDGDLAMEQLRRARRISQGHSWTATTVLHCLQKTIFVESCILLYTGLLEEARKLMQVNPQDARKLCVQARRRAYDACDHEGEAKALMTQGQCEMRAGDVSAGCECFYKVLLMHLKANRAEEACEARIELLSAYLKLGNWTEAYLQLKTLLEFAQEHNLAYYVGQSYRYLGEYYLMHGNPNLATPLLIKALDAFHKIGDVNNREHTKNFAAVSAGQELMPKYVNFILKCGKPGSQGFDYVMKLVRWKDTRDVSWSEECDESVTQLLLHSARSGMQQSDISGIDLSFILKSRMASCTDYQEQKAAGSEMLDLLLRTDDIAAAPSTAHSARSGMQQSDISGIDVSFILKSRMASCTDYQEQKAAGSEMLDLLLRTDDIAAAPSTALGEINKIISVTEVPSISDKDKTQSATLHEIHNVTERQSLDMTESRSQHVTVSQSENVPERETTSATVNQISSATDTKLSDA